MIEMISMKQLEWYLEQDADMTLLDVRSAYEFLQGHLEGAVNIPLEELEKRAEELDRRRPVVVYCAHGSNSLMAARILGGLGFQVFSAMGGLSYYRGRHFTVP